LKIDPDWIWIGFESTKYGSESLLGFDLIFQNGSGSLEIFVRSVSIMQSSL
ncbi:6671_t:CDS:2, partial [Cetraspora pellucida]